MLAEEAQRLLNLPRAEWDRKRPARYKFPLTDLQLLGVNEVSQLESDMARSRRLKNGKKKARKARSRAAKAATKTESAGTAGVDELDLRFRSSSNLVRLSRLRLSRWAAANGSTAGPRDTNRPTSQRAAQFSKRLVLAPFSYRSKARSTETGAQCRPVRSSCDATLNPSL